MEKRDDRSMSGNESTSAIHFELSEIPIAKRRRTWSTTLNDFFYNCELDLPTDFIFGRIDGVRAGGLRTARVVCDPLSVRREPSHVANDSQDVYFVLVPAGPSIALTQRNRTAEVKEGDFAFVDAGEPYSYRQDRRQALDNIIIPGSLLRNLVPDIQGRLGQGFGKSGLDRLFVDFAKSVCAHVHKMDEHTGDRLARHFTDLLALVLTGADDRSNETAIQDAHFRRAMQLIEARFADPLFGIGELAGALHLSERYVQRIFAVRGNSVSIAVRRRRVAEAVRMLRLRNVNGMSVAMIGRAVGYADPAYFSRVFRAEMGRPPGDF